MSILRDNVNGGAAELRRLIKKSVVTVPGVFNGISALLAQATGFKALYLSGSGVAGKAGLPDLGITTLTEIAEEARKIVAVSRLPLIVDIDTGFGETLNVIRAVRTLESAGVAAVHIEDQEMPKKCGHLSGKRIVAEEEMIRKLRAAASAKRSDDFIIIARTDARAVEGLDSSIERAKGYIDAGADAIFPEALESRAEFAFFAKKVKTLLVANMTEFGKSPLLNAAELGKMGYKIVLFPLTGFRASLLSMKDAYSLLCKEGTQKHILNKLMTREEFYNIISYKEYENEDHDFHDA